MMAASPHDFTRRLLAETREEIARADGKASILLAAAGVAVAVLGGGVIASDINIADASGIVQACAIMAAMALVAGTVALGLAVYPELGQPQPGRARYFMEQAAYASDADLAAALQREADNADERDVHQLAILAKSVRRKYQLTRAGQTLFALSLALVAATLATARIV